MEKLYQEVGFIAYHFHWSRDEIMDLPHKERHRWVQEISEINKKINKTSPAPARSMAPPRIDVPPGTRVLSPGLNLSNE